MSDLQNTARARADLNKLLEKYGKEMFELGYKVGKSGSRIVQCKDCKHWKTYDWRPNSRITPNIAGNEYHECEKFDNFYNDNNEVFTPTEDFYCAFGEEDNDD
jgi:hypothetical protein